MQSLICLAPEVLSSFATSMLLPRWLAVACALLAMIAMLWAMTGITIFAVRRLSAWLLRRCFGVAPGTDSHERAPRPADLDIHPPKPADAKAAASNPGRPLQEQLSELGVGKGSKLRVTSPKRPKTSGMREFREGQVECTAAHPVSGS